MKSPPQKQPSFHPEQMPNDPPVSLEEKLALAQQKVAKWTQMASSPNLSPAAAAWAQNIALSAKAEVRLREKALAYDAARGATAPPAPRPSVPMSLADWQRGITLAALSLAQQASAGEAQE